MEDINHILAGISLLSEEIDLRDNLIVELEPRLRSATSIGKQTHEATD